MISENEKYLINICENAKKASKELMTLKVIKKNEILNFVADKIIENANAILEENKKDIENAQKQNYKSAYIERLTLNNDKVLYMADTLKNVAKLKDVIDQFDSMQTLENGLVVGKKRVPLGVVALIFESRPNMIVDAFSLCLKSGNAVILRGGKEAILTNIKITQIIQEALEYIGYNKNFVQLISNTDRELVSILVKQNKYIDVIIPRGSKTLIDSVVLNSTVPVIETGVGNCHMYVDKYADIKKAISVVNNAKTNRVSVCNALETLLVHEDIAPTFLPLINKELSKSNVELRCCDKSLPYVEGGVKACEDDFKEEFLDYILAVKTVSDIDEAIKHIDEYGTKHSESIITENYTLAQKFLNEVDSSAVYVNASTRFTDGDMFGFGGEIGISTQKLHARGPMGLKELTTYKYVIYGDGQIR